MWPLLIGCADCAVLYRGANYLAQYKIDMDKFRTPTSYEIFPSILRMRCVKLCAPGMGCRRGGFSACCMQCEGAT